MSITTVGELRAALEPLNAARPIRLTEVYDEPDEYVVTEVMAEEHFPAPASSDAAAVTLWIARREE